MDLIWRPPHKPPICQIELSANNCFRLYSDSFEAANHEHLCNAVHLPNCTYLPINYKWCVFMCFVFFLLVYRYICRCMCIY